MKELSREEKLEQRISELEQLIAKRDGEFDKEQGKRVKITFFVLSIAIYLIAFMGGAIRGDIKEYLGWLIFAPIMAGIAMFISFLITTYITNGAMKRVETIAKLKGELNTIKFSKYADCEEKKIEDIKADLKPLNNFLRTIIDEYKNLELNEDFESDAEENEILKVQLEDLKSWLNLIDNECKYLKRKKVFDDEVE
jgi:uncharacterized membrane protein